MASNLQDLYLEARFENETGKGYYLLKAAPAGDTKNLLVQVTFHANPGQTGINDFITAASNLGVPAWAIGALRFDAGNIINFAAGLNELDDDEALAAQNQATIEANQNYIESGAAAEEASEIASLAGDALTFEEALQYIIGERSQQNEELASQVPNRKKERFLRYMKLFGFSISDLAEKIYNKGAVGWKVGSETHMYGGTFVQKWLLQPAKARFSFLDTAGLDNQIQFVLPKTVKISDKKRVEAAQADESPSPRRPNVSVKTWWKEAATLEQYAFNSDYDTDVPDKFYTHRNNTLLDWTLEGTFYYFFGEVILNHLASTNIWTPQTLWVPNIYIDEEATAQLAVEQAQADASALAAGEVDMTGAGMTQAQKDAKLPLSEQAILLYRLPTLATANKMRRYIGEYDRFAALDADSQSEMEVIVNTLTSPLKMDALFDLIKPRHLSAVIPRVRLFKLYNKDDPRMKDVRNRDEESRVVVEMELDEFLREEIRNPDGTLKTGDILGSTLSTNTGVGIEAFTWEFNGTNEFEAERLVTANLKLRAQSVDALEEQRISKKPKPIPYRFSDLFIPDEREVDVPRTPLQSSGQFHSSTVSMYESRALIEYGVDPDNSIFKGPEGSDERKIFDALKALRLSINMVINSYTIDLRDDGSVVVDINFTGRLEAHSKDPYFGNILPDNHAGKSLKERADTFLRERDFMLFGDTSDNHNPNSAKNLQAALDAKNAQKASLEAQRKEGIEVDENEIERLSREIPGLSKQIKEINKKYKSEMTEEEYIKSLSTELDRLQLYQSIYKGLLRRKALRVLTVDPRNIAPSPLEGGKVYCSEVEEATSVETAMSELVDSDIGKLASYEELNTKDFMDKNRLAFQESLTQITTPSFTNTSYRIPYIYFGDLMDTVLDNMLTNRDDLAHDIRTVLGPIVLKRNHFLSSDFKSNLRIDRNGHIVVGDEWDTPADVRAETAKMKSAVKQSSTQLGGPGEFKNHDKDERADVSEVMANLADVPISFKLFLQWFADKVSNTGVYSYSLKAFMADAIRSLIFAATQADSTQLILPKQQIKLENVTWQSSHDRTKPCPLGFTQIQGQGLRCQLPEDTSADKTVFWSTDSYKGVSSNSSVSQMPDAPVAKRRKLTLSDLKNAARQRNAKMPMGQASLSGAKYDSDYMMVYALPVDWNRKYSPGRMTKQGITEYQRDMDEGVYHLESGRDAGMVKSISMSAYPSEGYEEMQIMNALKGGKRPTQRIYQASVTLNGITFFRPGQTVYINAAAYGNFKTLQKFGLCGYYTVRTTSCRISSGEFITELVCDFRSKGEHLD